MKLRVLSTSNSEKSIDINNCRFKQGIYISKSSEDGDWLVYKTKDKSFSILNLSTLKTSPNTFFKKTKLKDLLNELIEEEELFKYDSLKEYYQDLK